MCAYVFVCMCACMREGVCVGTEGREGKRMREKVCKKKNDGGREVREERKKKREKKREA